MIRLETVTVPKTIMPEPMNLLDHGSLQLIDYMGSDQVEPYAISIVKAARVSVEGGKRGEEKTREDDAKLVAYLASSKNNKPIHSSPFEMCEIVFYVKCPFFVRSQWHRHRTFSYNEVSGRYSSTIFTDFYVPEPERLMTIGSPGSRQGGSAIYDETTAFWHHDKIKVVSEELFRQYHRLVEEGMANELARTILPCNTYTEFYAKASLWNWARFLAQRTDSHAQLEMRVYADAVFEVLSKLFPVAMRALNANFIHKEN